MDTQEKERKEEHGNNPGTHPEPEHRPIDPPGQEKPRPDRDDRPPQPNRRHA